MSALVQSFAAVRWRLRTGYAEAAGFVLLTAAILALYWFLRAPVFDPPNYLDPWIYTALFKNYGYLHSVFGWTYYPSRLPWLIPGMIAHSIFGPVTAFFVLHAIFFLSAGLFLFLLLRRFFGTTAAFVGYGVLLLSPLFYDAYANDYPDGALLTFIFGALYFALSPAGGLRGRLRMTVAGFFMAAALGTNLFSGVILACALLLYAATAFPRPQPVRGLGLDAACAVAGALVLLFVCGSVSKSYGGEFLFFMPSVRAISGINSTDYKAAGYTWLLSEPQLLVPLFAAASLLVPARPRELLRSWRSDPAVRLAVGSFVFAVVLSGLIAVWEFAFHGDFLETYYYFSLFNVATSLCLGSTAYLLLRRCGGSWNAAAVTAAVAIAAALPMLLVYRIRDVPLARSAGWLVVMMMGASLALLIVASRVRPGATAALLAVGALCAVAFSANYAAAAGRATQSVFDTRASSYAYRRDVLRTALQLIDFMRDNHLQSRTPSAFWYNPRGHDWLNGIQSTYLWGDSWIGLDMPRFSADARRRLEHGKPPYVVLLCTSHACAGAPAALAKAGYPVRPVAERLLGSGGVRLWARAFRIPKFRLAVNSREAFYLAGAIRLSAPTAGAALRSWSWASAWPSGWSGAAAEAARAAHGAPFTTSSRPWDYELLSPKLTLPAGTYRAELSGAVTAGGLDVGVFDVEANKWIAQTTYWSRQRGFGRKVMATQFSVLQPTKIEVILSNWVPKAQSSEWRLRTLRLVRARP